MSLIMVLGDTHHYWPGMEKALNDSKAIHYTNIIQVGDLGLWTHTNKGLEFLDKTNDKLALHGRKMYAVGGNHENWDHWNWYVENMPKDEHGFARIRSHIYLAPRVHSWVWGGKKFFAVAGAASIDKDIRLDDERAGGHKSWWWQEQITDEEVFSIPNVKRDYLFTHDCSNRTPWGFDLKVDQQSYAHRQRIDEALRRTTPNVHVHGHMHTRYEWENLTGDDHWTKTYGLTCNGNVNSWGILNTVTDTFTFNR